MRTLIALAEDEDERSEGAGTHRWMVSYADFITLLFVLFLALYARMPKLAEDGASAPSGRQAQTARDARPASQHVQNGHVATTPAVETELPTPRPAAPAETQLPTPAPAPIAMIVAQAAPGATAAPVPPATPAVAAAAQASAAPAVASAVTPASSPLPQVAPQAPVPAAPRTPNYPPAAPLPLDPNSRPIVPNQFAPSQTSPERAVPRPLAERLNQVFADQTAGGNVTVVNRPDGVMLEIADTSLFTSGTAQPAPQAAALIARLAQAIGTGNARVVVEGHTDNQPIRSAQFPSNWELSSARAASVARALQEHGVSSERLTASGMAQTRPRASNESEQGRRQNRRVSIIILNG